MATELASVLGGLAVALGIGLLVGLQREHAGAGPLAAGSRTFPLVALAGALCQHFFPPLLPVALGGVVVLAALGYVLRVREVGDPGLATPVSAVLMFLLGALVMVDDRARVVAIVVSVAVTVVLALKGTLHGFAKRLSPEEIRATLAFLVVALVVLPLLPDRPLPWLLGLNPRFVWTMVVLVSAIDLAAYLFVRAFATKGGHLLAGVVGGLVSSTAATVSMARRSRLQPGTDVLLRIGIVVASAVMLVRILIETAIVAPALLRTVAPPVAVVLAWCVALVAVWLRRPMPDAADGAGPRNPFRLTPALLFGVAFAVVLLATGWLHDAFGDAGLYAAALVSGLVDVDAATLSLARLSATGDIGAPAAATGILLVTASNFTFKLALVLALGTRRLLAWVALALAAAPAVAVALLLTR